MKTQPLPPFLLTFLQTRIAAALLGAILVALLGMAGLPTGATAEALMAYRILAGIPAETCPPCPEGSP